MNDKYIVKSTISVKDAIEKMEKELIKAVVVVDDNNNLIGLFSNGDMRSFFLKGGILSSNICDAMNKTPIVYESIEEIIEERKTKTRVIYPIVLKGKLIDIIDFESAKDRCNDSLHNVPLVIMAGGKGTRLYPYTKILPKPLIPIGDLTITERIINQFRKYGCKDVNMILNYKSNMIRAYLADIEKDYSINYVEEKKFCGTGGGLKLLSGIVNKTFFLSNCDILVNCDLECIYKTHKMKGNKITFVCAMKDFVIPYGVINTNKNGDIISMTEKPDYSFLINTGLYVIEPDVIDEIKDDEFIHLPDLAMKLINKGERVGVFPVSEESWMDMGQFTEMEDMLKRLGIEK